jgi:hypothetical protein
MDWTFPQKKEYFMVSRLSSPSRSVGRISSILKKNKLYDGGIRLSGEIFDRLLVRLSS